MDLHSDHLPAARRALTAAFRCVLLPVLLAAFGCAGDAPAPADALARVLPMAATDDQARLARALAAEYMRLHPDVRLRVLPMAPDALADALARGDVELALTPVRLAAPHTPGAPRLVELHVAEDALVVLAHPRAPQRSLALPDAAPAAAPGGVQWVWQAGRSAVGVTAARALGAQPHATAGSSAGVVLYVARHPEALGLLTLGALGDSAWSSVRILPVASDSGAEAIPTPAAVFRAEYPLRYPVYLYTTSASPVEATGFASFAVGTRGQQIVQDAGLAPAVLPARYVMLGER